MNEVLWFVNLGEAFNLDVVIPEAWDLRLLRVIRGFLDMGLHEASFEWGFVVCEFGESLKLDPSPPKVMESESIWESLQQQNARCRCFATCRRDL